MRRLLSIRKALIIYFIVSLLLIVLFGFLYYISESVEFVIQQDKKVSFWESIYFSSITYFTVGFGDIVPIRGSYGHFIIMLESLFGTVINSVILAYIFHRFLIRPNDIIMGKYINILYNSNDSSYSLCIRIGNKGNRIVNLKMDIQIMQVNDGIRSTLFHIYDQLTILNKSWNASGRLDRDSISFINKYMDNRSKFRGFRCVLTGTDMKTGNLVSMYKYYSIDDVRFIKKFEFVYKWISFSTTTKTNFRKFDDYIEMDKEYIDLFKSLSE